MITREFDYTADGFDAEQPVQMATLRMEHHNGDGFKAAKREALAIMGKDYPNATLKVRDSYRNGRFYAAFLIDAGVNE